MRTAGGNLWCNGEDEPKVNRQLVEHRHDALRLDIGEVRVARHNARPCPFQAPVSARIAPPRQLHAPLASSLKSASPPGETEQWFSLAINGSGR
jgi:hypothetical protein